jgi:phenylalanyl-tRNA synthetase alpha chain
MQDPESICAVALHDIDQCEDDMALEALRVHYLGKKGVLTEALRNLGSLPAEERPRAGQIINEAKRRVQDAIIQRGHALRTRALDRQLRRETVDVTLPGRGQQRGGLHPITITMERIEDLLAQAGFTVAEGPEIENDYYNFEALNIPAYHPARAMHDTFYFEDGSLLRTPRLGFDAQPYVSSGRGPIGRRGRRVLGP